jgi:hypothetical protein
MANAKNVKAAAAGLVLAAVVLFCQPRQVIAPTSVSDDAAFS